MSFLLNERRIEMTNLSLRSLDIPSIHKFAVGFDNMFDELLRHTNAQAGTNYPPYNVVKFSDDKFAIELAVAGFKDGDIDVTVEKNQLTVKGEKSVELNENIEYLHRGISARNFLRSWTLADHVEVTGAEIKDGILTVQLERQVPEEQKPKKIAITYTK
jgi:molecular chaperone IbpA